MIKLKEITIPGILSGNNPSDGLRSLELEVIDESEKSYTCIGFNNFRKPAYLPKSEIIQIKSKSIVVFEQNRIGNVNGLVLRRKYHFVIPLWLYDKKINGD